METSITTHFLQMYTPYFRVICYIFLVSIFSKNFFRIINYKFKVISYKTEIIFISIDPAISSPLLLKSLNERPLFSFAGCKSTYPFPNLQIYFQKKLNLFK